jgi:hypothetical protein
LVGVIGGVVLVRLAEQLVILSGGRRRSACAPGSLTLFGLPYNEINLLRNLTLETPPDLPHVLPPVLVT